MSYARVAIDIIISHKSRLLHFDVAQFTIRYIATLIVGRTYVADWQINSKFKSSGCQIYHAQVSIKYLFLRIHAIVSVIY